jgi:hypothetical protein
VKPEVLTMENYKAALGLKLAKPLQVATIPISIVFDESITPSASG